jgi:hypothetical protein
VRLLRREDKALADGNRTLERKSGIAAQCNRIGEIIARSKGG